MWVLFPPTAPTVFSRKWGYLQNKDVSLTNIRSIQIFIFFSLVVMIIGGRLATKISFLVEQQWNSTVSRDMWGN